MARVLIADNDPDALALLLLDLRLEHHVVLGVPGGEQVLAALEAFAPDVVVLDHRMPPGPTGIDVARRLRAEHPALTVLIYSNYQDATLLRQAAELGLPFLAKGNLRTLRTAISA